MIAPFSRMLPFAIALVISITKAFANPILTLTDITVFSTDSSGSYISGDVWDTEPAGNFDIWIQNGSSFLNGPTDTSVRPLISLSPGVNTFTLFGDPGIDRAYFGINLFFNNFSAPFLSAYAPILASLGPHTFMVNGASDTIGVPSTQHLPASGALSFISGSYLVTLTDFYWATPSVYNLDEVGQTATGADGSADYVGGFTLSVTPVPEPQLTFWLTGLFAAAVAYRKNRERKD